MKVSYKVLKRYIPHIDTPEQIAQDLIMHTAEVEGIESEAESFENIVYGVISSIEAHPDADSLKVCMVDIGESEDTQIVCGGSNLQVGQGVAVAKIGASVVWHGQGDPVIMKLTKIRGIESSGMICASEEIGLKEDFPAKDEKEILDLSSFQAKPGTNLAVLLGKDDVILEIDNKAINHRPDLFSHIGIAREIEAIKGKKLPYDLTEKDFSHLKDLEIQNHIPQAVKRYIGLKVSGVSNIPSPDYVKDVLKSHGIDSKGLLIDITNYSLYLYGQPTHCFDADKISGNIHVRFAKEGESFTALNDKNYTLSEQDIVIADDKGVIALGGVIGGKDSAVSVDTKKIVIESAWFDQALIRKTGKRLGVRTDALNVFEKELVDSLSHIGVSLIIKELEEHFEILKLEAISDIYPDPRPQTRIEFLPDYIRNLIGKNYSEEMMLKILDSVGVEKDGDILLIPRWRKDLSHIADIAEEIARLDGYESVKSTIPRINLGAITQSPLYSAKRKLRSHFVSRGFFEMYTYSFIGEKLAQKAGLDISKSIPLKNFLSEEASHMRPSLIPLLLESMEQNIREYSPLKLFECEKVYKKEDSSVSEFIQLGVMIYTEEDNAFYPIRKELDDLFHILGISRYEVKASQNIPAYFHSGRSGEIIVRGKSLGYIGEIRPKVLHNFEIPARVGAIELDVSALSAALFELVKAKEISNFQENSFDINFVVDQNIPGLKIQNAIAKSDNNIGKVELFDIYESEEKLPGKRSLSFTVYYQSLTETLDDAYKQKLLETIIANVEKVGGKLR